MRQTTAKKVATLLEAVAVTITTHNRPRKSPGKNRNLAANVLGRRVNVHSPEAAQFSLLGAFRADARTLGYSTYVRRAAEHQLLWATDYLPYHEYFPTLAHYDNAECDTRAIARLCRKTANQIGNTVSDEVMAEAA